MQPNAIALANYFIDKSLSENIPIYQLGLMKRVYIAHGFTLAFFDKSAIDPRFDVVEAWKYGPVIPSVYHSFKHNGNSAIIEKSVVVTDVLENGQVQFSAPTLENKDIIDVTNFVWDRYINFTDSQLVDLTHREGTPWALCYVEGKNNPIPDLYTKVFYEKLIIKNEKK
jgi:uncharacterized phage-associated protein